MDSYGGPARGEGLAVVESLLSRGADIEGVEMIMEGHLYTGHALRVIGRQRYCSSREGRTLRLELK